MRAMNEIPVSTLVGGLGFAAGIVFGAVAQRTDFCTMGALSDIVFLEDYRRFRAWLLAIAVAILGSTALHLAGLVDLGRSIYLTPNLGWLGAILGGLMFGFGMTMTGGCGNKTLVRIGAGNLKSIVVFLVLGLFAYMTLRGLLGLARVTVIEPANLDLRRLGVPSQGLPELAAAATGISAGALRGAIALIAAGALLLYCFRDAAFRAAPATWIGAGIIGLLIPAGWAITGIAGADEFDPVPLASFTFVAPIGESLQYLMLFTGSTISFGVATVGGVILGAFLMAVATGRFRIEGFTDTADMIRHLTGAALMGTGGVLALGCTIGQGITGLSTLALGSVIAWVSIVAGGFLGFLYLEEGSLRGALRALAARRPG